jgi:Reeler domain
MRILPWLLALANLATSTAYTGGARDCNVPGHGTFKTSLPTDMTLSLIDTSTSATETEWSAGKTYTVQIQTTVSNFKGWSWAPLKGTPASFTAGSTNMAGSFAAGDSYSHVNTGCAGSITQTSGGTSRTIIKALWTPPAAGTGTVSLWAMIVVSKNGNNYNAVQTINEAPTAATTTTTASASYGASVRATSTTSTRVSSTATAQVPVPVPAPGQVPIAAPNTAAITTSGNSNTNLVAIAVGSAIGGGALVAMSVVLGMMINRRKTPIMFTPTVMTTGQPVASQDTNPYMAHVGNLNKVAFNPTSARQKIDFNT